MTDSNRPVVSWTTPQTPLMDKATGQISFTWIKWFQGIQQTINNAFDQQGNFDGNLGPDASITGRNATILVILQNIDDIGVVTASGIDFARAYINKDTDHINDGTGSPLAGGKEAFLALVSSAPAGGQFLEYDGAEWIPKHPEFTDIEGIAAVAQIPELPESQIVGLTADLAAKAPLLDPDFTGPVAVTGAVPQVGVGTATPLNPAGADTGSITVSDASSPQLLLQATGGGADQKVARLISRSSNELQLQFMNDAVSSENTVIQFNRGTGTALTSTEIFSPLKVDGNLSLTSATTATSATTGSATILPALPVGYLEVSINGTAFKLPYYNV